MIIKVDYYDDSERQKIENNFPDDFLFINDIAGKKVNVSYEDFKVYAVFGYQYDVIGYRTFSDLSRISMNISRLETLLHFDNEIQSIVKTIPERPIINSVSEELGIAGGLTIASEIYSLTQADWQLIPQTIKHKDFDFQLLAASHRKYINIEAKGCINENNLIKSSAVSNHKSNIINKKNNAGFNSI